MESTIASTGSPDSSRILRAEIRDYLHARDERRRILPRAALVGLLSGFVAVAFRLALDGGQWVRDQLGVYAHHVRVVGPLLLPLFCGMMAMLSVLLVRRFAPETAGSGIPHLEAVLRRFRSLIWERVLPVKFMGGALAVGLAGMALGREGPTVQMGGAVGDGVAHLFKGNFRDRETLILSGAGAGLAAAFNAPLSGLVFVLEEMRREFTPLVLSAALVAAVIADVVSRLIGGQDPAFAAVPAYATPPVALLPGFALLGAVMGLLGIVFNRSLVGTLNLFAQFKQVPSWLAAGIVGVLVGVVAYWKPDMVGGGHHLAETALAGNIVLQTIPMLLVLRFVLTMACYGTGAPGGIFAPFLAIGSIAGLGFGLIAQQLCPTWVIHPGVFAVVGMAAYFTAIVRAPLTGIVLIVEMTGSYSLMLPLLLACLLAYLVTEALGDRPLYEALLERDLLRGGLPENVSETGTEAFAYDLAKDGPFAGKKVRDLGLPPGCVLVSRRHAGQESVPTASTTLLPGDRLLVVVDGKTAEVALPLLRSGFGIVREDNSEEPQPGSL